MFSDLHSVRSNPTLFNQDNFSSLVSSRLNERRRNRQSRQLYSPVYRNSNDLETSSSYFRSSFPRRNINPHYRHSYVDTMQLSLQPQQFKVSVNRERNPLIHTSNASINRFLSSRNSALDLSNRFYSQQPEYSNAGQPEYLSWEQYLLPEIDQKYQQILKSKDSSRFNNQLQLGSNKLMSNTNTNVMEASEKEKILHFQKQSSYCESRFHRDKKLVHQNGMQSSSLRTEHCGQKIESLQEQNENLRQQLFYLRQALLLNFQTNQKVMESRIYNKPKHSGAQKATPKQAEQNNKIPIKAE